MAHIIVKAIVTEPVILFIVHPFLEPIGPSLTHSRPRKMRRNYTMGECLRRSATSKCQCKRYWLPGDVLSTLLLAGTVCMS
jgi:hypothetical protein